MAYADKKKRKTIFNNTIENKIQTNKQLSNLIIIYEIYADDDKRFDTMFFLFFFRLPATKSVRRNDFVVLVAL